ncbi:hypothetical protein C5167_049821 [Papaver somniferum]|uniref:Uncharacterized protein n=1 Tax=Papaver somniferum TaxID=3469 RepID=A0A4Y7KQC8_PAPSO|nr:hypothetical protein C5167_049821 [Papaver somniferum]
MAEVKGPSNFSVESSEVIKDKAKVKGDSIPTGGDSQDFFVTARTMRCLFLPCLGVFWPHDSAGNQLLRFYNGTRLLRVGSVHHLRGKAAGTEGESKIVCNAEKALELICQLAGGGRRCC